MRDFERAHRGAHIDLVSLDTRDGAATASLYDIMQYPAILALQNNGQMVKEWHGEHLPLMNEVAYYASSAGDGIIKNRGVLSFSR